MGPVPPRQLVSWGRKVRAQSPSLLLIGNEPADRARQRDRQSRAFAALACKRAKRGIDVRIVSPTAEMQAQSKRPNDEHSIVLQLQKEALASAISVTNLLRKAKAVATKLGVEEALCWINRELSGYRGDDELPEYRLLGGVPQVLDQDREWLPLMFESVRQEAVFSTVHLRDPMGVLEAMTSGDVQRSYHKTFPPALKLALRKGHSQGAIEFGTRFSAGQVSNVVETVRTLILDWTLELEKAGVLGEGMTFTQQERDVAAPITHQTIIGNVGVVGNVSGAATVNANQSAEINLGRIRDLVGQARTALPHLPEDLRPGMVVVLDKIDVETMTPQPDGSLLGRLLGSLKTIAEQAAGNLTAAGIISLIDKLN